MSIIHKKTRNIYQKQHSRISKNVKTWNRIFGIYKDQSYGLGSKWYKNKIVLDAGCGNFGALTSRLDELGCKKIYACDIGTKWIKPMKKALKKRKVNLRKIDFAEGNVLKLNYQKNFFDFVALNGVLPHLKNEKEIEKAFKEGSRVCKKNGYFFVSNGVSGGLIQGVILPAVREHYKKDKVFRKFIDTLNIKNMGKIVKLISNVSKKNKGPVINQEFLKQMLSEDTFVFLQNHIQAPFWLTNELSPEYTVKLFKKNGFTKIKRIKKFVSRTDIRKFFAPLHFERDSFISKILYGKGYVQFVGQKK